MHLRPLHAASLNQKQPLLLRFLGGSGARALPASGSPGRTSRLAEMGDPPLPRPTRSQVPHRAYAQISADLRRFAQEEVLPAFVPARRHHHPGRSALRCNPAAQRNWPAMQIKEAGELLIL